jgi:hypothetical protein
VFFKFFEVFNTVKENNTHKKALSVKQEYAFAAALLINSQLFLRAKVYATHLGKFAFCSLARGAARAVPPCQKQLYFFGTKRKSESAGEVYTYVSSANIKFVISTQCRNTCLSRNNAHKHQQRTAIGAHTLNSLCK